MVVASTATSPTEASDTARKLHNNSYVFDALSAAYVLDEKGDFEKRCNKAMVQLTGVEDADEMDSIKNMIFRHAEYTGSIRPSIQSQLEEREQREHFRRMVKQLPPKQKAILELRINEQLSYDEIARISGRTVSTIKASVFFAMEKLRKLAKHV